MSKRTCTDVGLLSNDKRIRTRRSENSRMNRNVDLRTEIHQTSGIDRFLSFSVAHRLIEVNRKNLFEDDESEKAMTYIEGGRDACLYFVQFCNVHENETVCPDVIWIKISIQWGGNGSFLI